MNKLKDYLENNGIHKAWFAKQVGITATNLSYILSGKSLPRLKTAFDIEKASNGKVTVYDLLPEDESAPIKKETRKKK